MAACLAEEGRVFSVPEAQTTPPPLSLTCTALGLLLTSPAKGLGVGSGAAAGGGCLWAACVCNFSFDRRRAETAEWPWDFNSPYNAQWGFNSAYNYARDSLLNGPSSDPRTSKGLLSSILGVKGVAIPGSFVFFVHCSRASDSTAEFFCL